MSKRPAGKLGDVLRHRAHGLLGAAVFDAQRAGWYIPPAPKHLPKTAGKIFSSGGF